MASFKWMDKNMGSPAKVVMNPVQSLGYQDTESHSSLLVQDYQNMYVFQASFIFAQKYFTLLVI
ncbi:Uncharacterized protein dnm_015440 [Desulfonema magnum]|uniref:Uncharacterized protein n=1 Tax=Desulfonema magnum TaxID=45655 RepID=A0A975BHQ4_9BACT|nr:Uncharacterized protein dnm_015440 [Desulfonema magnum]